MFFDVEEIQCPNKHTHRGYEFLIEIDDSYYLCQCGHEFKVNDGFDWSILSTEPAPPEKTLQIHPGVIIAVGMTFMTFMFCIIWFINNVGHVPYGK